MGETVYSIEAYRDRSGMTCTSFSYWCRQNNGRIFNSADSSCSVFGSTVLTDAEPIWWIGQGLRIDAALPVEFLTT